MITTIILDFRKNIYFLSFNVVFNFWTSKKRSYYLKRKRVANETKKIRHQIKAKLLTEIQVIIDNQFKNLLLFYPPNIKSLVRPSSY